ncbi:MAG TPA: MMPL family transporter [Xanthobacteraceae bacterium]
MLTSWIVRIVKFCARHAGGVITAFVVLAVGCGIYTARHFALDTNIDDLMSPNLDWRKREIAYHTGFPTSLQLILVVVDGPTPELAGSATRALAEELAKNTDLFRSVEEQGGGPFFRRNGLLYLPTDQLEGVTNQLTRSGPLIGALSSDPSLRGLVQALSFGLMGVDQGQITLDAMARTLNMAADPIEKILAGQNADFSWKVLLQGEPRPSDLRHFIAVWPYLSDGELEPTAKPIAAIRQAASDLGLASTYRARVRITGPAPISDEELASANEGLVRNSVITGAIIVFILWLALRSLRLVLAVVITLGIGLVVTAALGLLIVGALNPISVAFAVLFVGLGADFAIQYTVRYRAQRHVCGDLYQALLEAADSVGAPLTLAAGAAAAGFLSFLPTPYIGLAQLGTIAGVGMGVAYVASLTLLPALVWAFNAPEEPRSLRLPAMAPVDRWLKRHRFLIVAVIAIAGLASLPALVRLQFDFDPLHLRDQNSESIATIRELSRDPTVAVNAAEVLTASDEEAAAVAKRLAALPEVEQTRTLNDFVPQDQDRKLPLIQRAALALGSALNRTVRPAPSDPDDIAALRSGADALRQAAGDASGAGADAARRLAADLVRLADSDEAHRSAVAAAFTAPLRTDLSDLRDGLQAGRISRASLPKALVRDWIDPEGHVRVEATAKGDRNDEATLRRFAQAVLAAVPNATGQAIATLEWGDTIVKSFAEAAAWALISIALLLWIVLRRLGDVLLTLVPLIVAAVATLAICAVTGFALNYANIIALPVLLGVGVAFKIYYILAWRRGQTDFLQSALTRAVFFSALLTATAFGSLWLSHHPGTSSMGKLLALSLACTLVSAVLFQPALMGEPRAKSEAAPPESEDRDAEGQLPQQHRRDHAVGRSARR